MSREPSFWEGMNYFVLLAYVSLAASRTLLQRLLACLNFTLDSEDLYFWYKQKEWFLWTMTAAKAAENHGDEAWPDTFDEGYIHQFQPSPTHKIHKDILPWNISQMITKTVPISTRIVISYAMKRAIPLWIWWKVNGNWDNNMIRISQWRESLCRTNTSVRRNK